MTKLGLILTNFIFDQYKVQYKSLRQSFQINRNFVVNFRTFLKK